MQSLQQVEPNVLRLQDKLIRSHRDEVMTGMNRGV